VRFDGGVVEDQRHFALVRSAVDARMHAVSVLDNPVWHALTGTQATVAEGDGRARRFQRDVSVFGAVPDDATPDDWRALLELAGPGGTTFVARAHVPETPGWKVLFQAEGTQMVCDRPVAGAPSGNGIAVERLDTTAVPEIMALVQRTRPGPFLERTIELGSYLGVREAGGLVALAGTRMRPPGWTEISAVCTDDAHRGRGLAKLLVARLVDEILARGEHVCLHAVSDNTPAIKLYESLGFSIRRSMDFRFLAVDQ
jgi:ribosomal protein S18 acetylase RimI-like enzyme